MKVRTSIKPRRGATRSIGNGTGIAQVPLRHGWSGGSIGRVLPHGDADVHPDILDAPSHI